MIKLSRISVAALFDAIRAANVGVTAAVGANQLAGSFDTVDDGPRRSQMMAAQLEGHRRATAEAASKQQNLHRMRSLTQSQLGIGLAERGMGYNPMIMGGGGGAAANAPFLAWSARRG